MTMPEWLSKCIEDCRTFPADAVLAYRLRGIGGVWDTVAHRTVDRIIRSGHVVIFAQTLDDAPEVPVPAGVVIRPLKPNDWPAFSSIVTQRDLGRFQALVAAGRHAVVAWRGSQPIGYGWVAERAGPDVMVYPLALPAHAAYLWDLYVLPGERSCGVGSALASARVRTARHLGFREGWRMIAPSNGASLRTLAKTGASTRVVGELRFFKIFGFIHSRFSPQIPATAPTDGCPPAN